MKALVVFYSLTGNTKKAAMRLSNLLDCDTEEIQCGNLYSGFRGMLRAAYHNWKGYFPDIMRDTKSPGDYDVVLIGAPIWVGRIAAPMRTYLQMHRGQFNRTGIFLTLGGSDPNKALDEIRKLCGSREDTDVVILAKDIMNDNFDSQLESFASMFFPTNGVRVHKALTGIQSIQG